LRRGRCRKLTFNADQHGSCSSLPLADIGRSWPALSRSVSRFALTAEFLVGRC